MTQKGPTDDMGTFDTSWPRPEGVAPEFELRRVVDGGSGNPSVLVGMLYAGEEQVARALEAVAEQSNASIDVAFFSGFDNRPGHEALYEVFSNEGSRYDYCLKLDADMVLLHRQAIAEVDAIARNLHADELIVPVHDWLSDQPIYGAHLFAPGLRWRIESRETRFVDPRPVNVQRRCVVPKDQLVFAEHNPRPSERDAYSFGLHRGGKLMQHGVPMRKYRCYQAHGQYQLARQILMAAKRVPDRRRYLALIGYRDVITGRVADTDYRQASRSIRATALSTLPDEELRRLAIRPWTRFGARVGVVRLHVRCVLTRIVKLFNRVSKLFKSLRQSSPT